MNILVNNSLCSSLRRVDLAHVSFILVLKKKGGALFAFYLVLVIVLKLSPLIHIKKLIKKKKKKKEPSGSMLQKVYQPAYAMMALFECFDNGEVVFGR